MYRLEFSQVNSFFFSAILNTHLYIKKILTCSIPCWRLFLCIRKCRACFALFFISCNYCCVTWPFKFKIIYLRTYQGTRKDNVFSLSHTLVSFSFWNKSFCGRKRRMKCAFLIFTMIFFSFITIFWEGTWNILQFQ